MLLIPVDAMIVVKEPYMGIRDIITTRLNSKIAFIVVILLLAFIGLKFILISHDGYLFNSISSDIQLGMPFGQVLSLMGHDINTMTRAIDIAKGNAIEICDQGSSCEQNVLSRTKIDNNAYSKAAIVLFFTEKLHRPQVYIIMLFDGDDGLIYLSYYGD